MTTLTTPSLDRLNCYRDSHRVPSLHIPPTYNELDRIPFHTTFLSRKGVSKSVFTFHKTFGRLFEQSPEPQQSSDFQHIRQDSLPYNLFVRRRCVKMTLHRLFSRLCGQSPDPDHGFHFQWRRMITYHTKCHERWNFSQVREPVRPCPGAGPPGGNTGAPHPMLIMNDR